MPFELGVILRDFSPHDRATSARVHPPCPDRLDLVSVRMGVDEGPRLLVRFGPVLAENAGANLASTPHLHQTSLRREADFAAGSARSVTVDELDHGAASLPGAGEFAVQLLQGFGDRWHPALEIYGFDQWPQLNKVPQRLKPRSRLLRNAALKRCSTRWKPQLGMQWNGSEAVLHCLSAV